MDNLGYLFAAFAIVWFGFFVYIWILFQRQNRLRRDIDLLKESIAKENV